MNETATLSEQKQFESLLLLLLENYLEIRYEEINKNR